MRREVLLSGLTTGRCFTLPPREPTLDEKPKSVGRSDPILAPAEAWRVTSDEDESVNAVNALGETRAFPRDQKVFEIPRQGFDKLAERSKKQG